MDTSELVRYNDAVRTLYFDALAKLPWCEVVKFRGASFDSLRDVFLHLTLVQDRWISYILVGRFPEWKDPDFESFQNFTKLGQYMVQVHENTEKYLLNLKPQDFQRMVPIPWGAPDTKIAVETALTHMVMEDMVHFGELSAMLWQMDTEAPYLPYWRYKLANDSKTKKP
jgi:uncharacterized damage-inducible protein DinB